MLRASDGRGFARRTFVKAGLASPPLWYSLRPGGGSPPGTRTCLLHVLSTGILRGASPAPNPSLALSLVSPDFQVPLTVEPSSRTTVPSHDQTVERSRADTVSADVVAVRIVVPYDATARPPPLMFADIALMMVFQARRQAVRRARVVTRFGRARSLWACNELSPSRRARSGYWWIVPLDRSASVSGVRHSLQQLADHGLHSISRTDAFSTH